jgi:peroxiredoxin
MIRKARSAMAACGIASLLAVVDARAADPSLMDLLKRLNLSGYSSILRAPEFSAVSSDKKKVSLADLSGRVIILNFWATWCRECRPEMRVFERLHREFVARGLSVVGINARERTVTVRDYSKELGLTFPLVLDSNGTINAAYGVIGLPTTFVIGRDGRPVALAVGPREWESTPARALIQMLLAQPSH